MAQLQHPNVFTGQDSVAEPHRLCQGDFQRFTATAGVLLAIGAPLVPIVMAQPSFWR